MAVQRHLPRAPITEAVIDIRVNLPQEVDIDRLKTIHASISKEYPQEAECIRGGVKFRPREKSVEATPITVYGYKYVSSDSKQVIQARLDGFTFSRLKPYETWENLRKEAYRLWEVYASLFSPERITRVALRYINCLEIPLLPLPSIEFKDYLVTPPEVPEKLPQGVNSFLTRVVIPIPSLGATAIIIQALEGISDPRIIPIILDIDVFKEAQFDANGKDAWETIDKLRDLKNEIFFQSITEKTVELFQ